MISRSGANVASRSLAFHPAPESIIATKFESEERGPSGTPCSSLRNGTLPLETKRGASVVNSSTSSESRCLRIMDASASRYGTSGLPSLPNSFSTWTIRTGPPFSRRYGRSLGSRAPYQRSTAARKSSGLSDDRSGMAPPPATAPGSASQAGSPPKSHSAQM